MFSNNLKKLRKENNLSQDKLAEELNKKYDTRVSKSMISRWERGSTDPQMQYVRIIADFFKTSPDQIDSNIPNTNNVIKLTDIYTRLNDHRQHKVVNYASAQLHEQENQVNERNHIVYLDGVVSAGYGEYQVDEHKEREPVEVHGKVPHHDIAVKVNGDSMEPTFTDGQILYVRKLKDPCLLRNGQFVIARIDDETFVKKFHKEKDQVKLISLNPNYKDIIIKPEDDFAVIGTVII